MSLAALATDNTLATRAQRVAAVAAEFVDRVDAQGRFPKEAVDAMKAERLLGTQVPTAHGGESAYVLEIAEVCSILGQA